MKSFPYSIAKSLSKWGTFEFDLATLTYLLLPRKERVSPPLFHLLTYLALCASSCTATLLQTKHKIYPYGAHTPEFDLVIPLFFHKAEGFFGLPCFATIRW